MVISDSYVIILPEGIYLTINPIYSDIYSHIDLTLL
jgi:hypothetical protein